MPVYNELRATLFINVVLSNQKCSQFTNVKNLKYDAKHFLLCKFIENAWTIRTELLYN